MSVVVFIKKGAFMFSFDLEDAYLQTPIRQVENLSLLQVSGSCVTVLNSVLWCSDDPSSIHRRLHSSLFLSPSEGHMLSKIPWMTPVPLR